VKEAMAKQGNTINISTTEQAQQAFRKRAGEVRGAGEEGGPRAAVSARVPRSNRSFVIPAKAGIQGFRVGWQGGGRCGFAPPRE
jgi:hypothetical protein